MAEVRGPELIAGAAERAAVLLDGSGLDVAGVAALSEGAATPAVTPEALARAERSRRTARRLSATGRLYGRATGVGANRMVAVTEADAADHDLRLLRSHAAGAGALLPAREVRAMLAVRANQLLAGGSGAHPDLVTGLVEALRLGVHPPVHTYGGVGTGDLQALAQTGLALIGELPWQAPDHAVLPAPVTLRRGDALALMSSNALTLGQAALACHDLDQLLRASHAVTALSLTAVSASSEPYAPEVHAARPHPGTVRAAAEVRRLLGPVGLVGGPRVQDPFGFRCFPQAHGPALEAAEALGAVLAVEFNSPAENPLISEDGPVPAAYHHGGFYAAAAGLALERLCLAVHQTARLSAARLSGLGDPELTGLRPFLADGPAASSGMMILEYSANAALAELRACAAPASTGHAVLSRGLEEAASFATQAARQALRAVDAYRAVLACELVAAVRALRQAPAPPAAPAYALASAALPAGTEDRPLAGDLSSAAALLPALAGL
jgi:histidine ammonia-lyase